MELPTPAVQQRAVGGVLHQRVLEDVFRIGCAAAAKDLFGAYQLLQRIVKLRLRQLRHGTDQLV